MSTRLLPILALVGWALWAPTRPFVGARASDGLARRVASRARPRSAGRAVEPMTRVVVAVCRRLGEAGLPLPAGQAVGAWFAVVGLVVVMAAAVVGWAAAVCLLLVVVVATSGGLRWAERRVPTRQAAQLPGALELVARSLRSGASIVRALDEAALDAGPLRGELVGVAEAMRRRGVVAGLDDWAATSGVPGVVVAAQALALAHHTGGGAARAIDGVAASLRERRALDDEVRALSAQARYSAAVMIVAPLGFAGVSLIGNADARSFLLGSGLGVICLGVGIALDLVGALWMAVLMRTGA